MGSSRLPGKVMKQLSGNTVLFQVVSRVRRAGLVDDVVVATTTRQQDDVLVKHCHEIGVDYYRGSESDVLARYLEAAEKYSADVVCRVTSDCPLIDPEIIDAVIRKRAMMKAEYANLAEPRTYPRGLDCEVFTMESLRKVASKADKDYERVHVTPYYYLHPDEFTITHVSQADDYSYLRWTLDTEDDFIAIKKIYDYFEGRNDMTWHEVLKLVQQHPEITALNAHVEQKQLHEL